MTTPDYSTTRKLTSEKPACFDTPVDGMQTLLKTPDSEQKIAEGGLRLQGLYKTSSEDKPLITVVTVVYNGAEFLEETIKSVIEQTYDNVEYIIVDGGSNDGTLEIIKKYGHAIDYWVSEPDKGIYDAMNKGINFASGVVISILNSDDYYYNNKVLEMISCKKFESALAGKTYLLKDTARDVVEFKSKGDKYYFQIPFMHPALFVKKKTYINIGLYNLRYSLAADCDFIMRLFKDNGKIDVEMIDCVIMRVGGASDKGFIKGRKEYYKAYVTNFKKPFMGALGFSLSIFFYFLSKLKAGR